MFISSAFAQNATGGDMQGRLVPLYAWYRAYAAIGTEGAPAQYSETDGLGDVTLFWPSEDLDAPDAVLDAAMEVVGAIGAFRPE